MLRILSSMDIELLLQQRIDGDVQIERKSRRSIDAEAAVDIETPRALDEAIDLAPAELKRLRVTRLVDVPGSLAFVVTRHVGLVILLQ
jgi:hypothetical protein